MGTHISFRHRTDPDDLPGSLLFDEDDFVDHFGMAYFSAFTQRFQKASYGIDYTDCLTYGPEGEETEMVGPPEGDDYHGWFTPDWDRAIVRAEKLLAAWEATSDEHRKKYDRDKLPVFIDLIRHCAAHPDRKNCQVSIHD